LPFEEAVTLLTGTIDPLSFDLTNLQRVADVPDQSSLTAWGDWGFAFADFEEGVLDEQGRPFTLIPRVIVLDPGGETAGEADGSLVDVAPGGQLLVSADLEERGEADGTRIMALTSPTTWIWPFGQEQLDSADRRPSFPVSPHALRLLPDGETVVALLPSGAGASQLTVESPGRSSIFSLEGALRLVDATGNGRFVVLHDVPALELVVVDLMLDEVHRLPVGAGRIIAVDIR
jgi:hypothetical protein